MITNNTNLDKIIDNIHSRMVYVQTHNFPDPDAIACAFGLSELLKAKGINAKICYKGNISKTVTAKMVKLLNIEVIEYFSSDDLEEDDEIILVDAQKGNANIVDMNGQEIICIDHHPIYEHVDYLFSDIRPEVGACSSIIASYYFENGIEMSKHVATALLYGIKMDTANLKRGVSNLDLDMFYKLFWLGDKEVLSNLDSSVMHYEDLESYKHAFATIDRRDDICFACAGDDSHEAVIASICDFMLTLDGVNLSVVSSRKKDGIKLSIRSNGTFDAGSVVKAALKGIGSGGGHEDMAGGFVPYDAPEERRDDQYFNNINNEIVERFLRELDH